MCPIVVSLQGCVQERLANALASTQSTGGSKHVTVPIIPGYDGTGVVQRRAGEAKVCHTAEFCFLCRSGASQVALALMHAWLLNTRAVLVQT